VTPRSILLECLRSALLAVDGRRAVREQLVLHPLRGPWYVVAIGKAAAAMSLGAIDALGELSAGGLIVVPEDHLPTGFAAESHGLAVLYGSHPVPDVSSLQAGEAVARFVAGLPADAQILFLVSGGASSLVEWLAPGATLDDLQALNRRALQSGAPIGEVNALRRKLSRLKGGGLARLAGARRSQALMMSDVPGDDPRLIGSGLLHSGDHDVPHVPVRIVASIRHACAAAAHAARLQGLRVSLVRPRFAGEAEALGTKFAVALARLPAGVLQVRGGESTVRLPERPGRGGRNQHLALAAAIALERRALNEASLLAAGTDGIDGSSADAGAIVDCDTCQRGRDAGCDPGRALAQADSGSFLEAAGDLLHTGPTLTNVGDLVLGLRMGGHR
jgi:hydroxypyruvate reductase